MTVTDTLGRMTAACGTLFFVISMLYWFNYLALGGGVNAIYVALWGLLLGTVSLIVAAALKWV